MTRRGAGTQRGPRAVWFAAVAIAIALVVGVIGWYARPHQEVQVGDRFDGVTVFADQTDPERLVVPVAFGSLTVNVGIGDEFGERAHRVHAPDGATLVEVSWTPGASGYAAPPVWPTSSAAERRDPGAVLTLLTGGRRYPIATGVTLADQGMSAVVVVQGDGSDARVETRYAGRRFTAAGTPKPRAPTVDGASGCDDTRDRAYSEVDCRLTVHRDAYVAGLGAAPEGKEWLVVTDASATREQRPIRLYGDGGARAEYRPSGPPHVSVTVDGTTDKPRIAGRDKRVGDAVQLADRAWLVAADRSSTVRMRYRLPTKIDRAQSRWPGAAETYEVDVWSKAVFPAA